MTLIELLTVMAIMVILIGAVVVAVLTASRRGPKEGAKGLLLQLAQGLEQYKATYGMYVPKDDLQPPPYSGIPPAPPPPYLTLDNADYLPPWTLQMYAILQRQASTFALWQALEYDGQYVSVAGTFKARGGVLTDPSTGVTTTGCYFTDPKTGATATWYYYKDYWGTPIRYVCPPPYNQYTLTSAGEDRTFGTPDDIVQP